MSSADDAQRLAAQTAELLVSLSERQVLLEQLFRIQRSIALRTPLASVLAAITTAAAELTGPGVAAGLLLIDDADPDLLTLAASAGLDPAAAQLARHERRSVGVAGRAVSAQALVHADAAAGGWGGFASSHQGFTASMAAPVHRDGAIVGALMVAARAPGRAFTVLERDALVMFAEHASLALNDASAVAAVRSAAREADARSNLDELTGRPNRAAVLARLGELLDAGAEAVTVLVIDLDRFKLVNDACGHEHGDAVLTAVATRLAAAARADDVVGRMSADEFVVVCRGLRPAAAGDLAHRLGQVVRRPVQVGGCSHTLSAAVGVAAAEPGDTAELVLRNAGAAMQRAKRLGSPRPVVFDAPMRRALTERREVIGRLREAVERQQLVLHYQPVVDAASRRLLAVEALVRWPRPDGRLALPGEFIAHAEEDGLAPSIDRWVLDHACEALATAFTGAPGPPANLGLSVNVSATHFADPALAALVAETLERHGLAPRRLTLEITESALLEESDRTERTLAELRSLGVRLAVDDFGTGWSSLSYLHRFAVDAIKLDRLFVSGLGRERSADAIVRAMLHLAAALDLSVVAEGVETEAQLERLRALAPRELARLGAQGYLFGAPRPLPEALDAGGVGLGPGRSSPAG